MKCLQQLLRKVLWNNSLSHFVIFRPLETINRPKLSLTEKRRILESMLPPKPTTPCDEKLIVSYPFCI